MLHFAYGSNMNLALMRGRCRSADALGLAVLRGFQFLITRGGYASVIPARGAAVIGVLWRVRPRDLVALNLYESVGSGLYRAHMLPVDAQGRHVRALVYVARTTEPGSPRPGYLELVLEAAREWGLPADYARKLGDCSASGWRGARVAEAGEIACPASAM